MNRMIKISDRVLKLVGQNLYSATPVFPITIRELLQNSFDAQKSNGMSTPIDFSIIKHSNNEGLTLICKDMGIGMTEPVIRDKFLVLGESGKEDGVGGFGVAKAAIILACDNWKLLTRDNCTTSDSDIAKVAHKDGCEITLSYTDEKNARTYPTNRAFCDAMIFLATSATGSRVTLINKTVESERVVDFAGLYTNSGTLLEEVVVERNNIKIHSVPVVSIPAHWMYDGWDSKGEDSKLSGKCIYRLNGLTQFVQYCTSGVDMNIVIDITTTARPDDGDYPYSLSREGVSDVVASALSGKLDSYFANYLTTAVQLKERSGGKKVSRKFYSGDLHSGEASKANDVSVCSNLSALVTGAVLGRLMPHQATVPKDQDDASSSIIELLEQAPTGIKTMIRRWGKTGNADVTSKKHIKILKVWAELVALVMNESSRFRHSFGIGFVLDDDYGALRETQPDGVVYYLINPKDLKTSDSMNTVMKMLFLACHEVAHTRYGDHGEGFTSAHHKLFSKFLEIHGAKTLYEIARNLRVGK